MVDVLADRHLLVIIYNIYKLENRYKRLKMNQLRRANKGKQAADGTKSINN